LKAKTSYRRRRIELIVERLDAERKKLDIGIEAELEAERREVERREPERREPERREPERREAERRKAERREAEQREAERREAERREVVGKLDIAVEVASTESKLEVEDSS
jgi:hypothetical protein